MAGIRVITYTDSDARNVLKLVKETFEIHPKHTIDKTEELGTDRVGYRSIHCIGFLGKKRLKLPEYKVFEGTCFEIKIRTILQHTWAEFEHDRNYKFSGILPKYLRRRLSIVAGNLELIDREFDSISGAIDNYVAEVGKKTETGDLAIPIDSKSLMTYMEKKFLPLLDVEVPPSFGNTTIKELSAMGIKTLRQFEDIIPKDYIERKSKKVYPGQSFVGIIRCLLMIHNAEKLLKYWKKIEMGIAIPEPEALFLRSYGVDLDKYLAKYDLEVVSVEKRKSRKRRKPKKGSAQ